MRRAIAKALLLFMFFANVAWAMDLGALGIASPSTEIVATGSGSLFVHTVSDHGKQTQVPCDHSCHGSAHYTGLVLAAFAVPVDRVASAPAFCLSIPSSRAKEPPLQPPKI